MEMDLDDWNPMNDDYRNEYFNSYGGGYGQRSPEMVRRPPLLSHPFVEERSDVQVTNIPHNLNERSLFDMFSQCGTVLNVNITTTQNGSKIGYVGFATYSGAVQAIKRFNFSGPNKMNVQHCTHSSGQVSSQNFSQFRGRGQTSRPRRGGQSMRGSGMTFRNSNSSNYFDNDDVDGSFQSLSISKNSTERTVFLDDSKVVDYKFSSEVHPIKVVRRDLTCLRCGTKGSYKCTKCKGCYCSEECQRSHWSVHKKVCRPPGEIDIRCEANNITNPGGMQHSTLGASGGYDSHVKTVNQRGKNVTKSSRHNQPISPGFNINSLMANQPNSPGFNIKPLMAYQRGTDSSNKSQPNQVDSLGSDVQSRPVYRRDFNASRNTQPHQTNSFDSSFNSGPVPSGSINIRGGGHVSRESQIMNESKKSDLESFDSSFNSRPVPSRSINIRGGGHISRDSRINNDSKKSDLKTRPCVGGEEKSHNAIEEVLLLNEFASNEKVAIQLNVPLKVEVSHTDNPSNFFVHLCDLREELKSMMKNLQVDADNRAVPERLVVNQMVAARFTDGFWYRAVVKKVNSDGTVFVYYIDYGNVSSTISDNVRCLSKTLASVPSKAILCSLAEVKPLTNSWCAKDNDMFKLCIENYSLNAIFLEQVEGKHLISLKDDEGNDVGELLCMSGHACRNIASSLDYWVVGENVSLNFEVHNSKSELWFTSLPSMEEGVSTLLTVLSEKCHPVTDNSFAYVGAIVCARSPADGAWYRAVVRRRTNEEILVQYIDFGNSEVVTELCCVPEEYRCTYTLAVLLVFESVSEASIVHDDLKGDALIAKVVEVQPDTGKVQVAIGNKLAELMVYSVMHNRFRVAEKAVASSSNVDAVHLSSTTSGASNTSTTVPVHEETQFLKPKVEENQHEVHVFKQETNTDRQEVKTETEATVLKYPVPRGKTRIIVLNLESLDSVFVWVPDKYLQELPHLQEALSETSKSLSQLTMLPSLGQFVCGQFTADDSWYRCCVVDICSFDQVTVLYVDFGNKEVLPLDRIKPLLPDFTRIPALALQVKIDVQANVSLENLRDVVTEENNNSWDMSVLDDTTSPITVRLFKGERTLNEFLGGEPDNSVAVSDTKVVSSPPVPMVKPSCYRVQLDVGSQVVFIVVEISSNGHMYGCIKNEEQLNALDALVKVMTEWCEKEQVPLDDKPILGSLCLAKSAEYNEWYRAEILSVNNDKCCVFYIDYGNSETVVNTNMRPLLPEFCVLPFQIVECKLQEFNCNQESVAALRKYLTCPLIVDVVGKDDDVYIIRSDELSHLGQ